MAEVKSEEAKKMKQMGEGQKEDPGEIYAETRKII